MPLYLLTLIPRTGQRGATYASCYTTLRAVLWPLHLMINELFDPCLFIDQLNR